MNEMWFLGVAVERCIEAELTPDLLEDGCLLCSEEKPHRRLVAEYLMGHGHAVTIVHIT